MGFRNLWSVCGLSGVVGNWGFDCGVLCWGCGDKGCGRSLRWLLMDGGSRAKMRTVMVGVGRRE